MRLRGGAILTGVQQPDVAMKANQRRSRRRRLWLRVAALGAIIAAVGIYPFVATLQTKRDEFRVREWIESKGGYTLTGPVSESHMERWATKTLGHHDETPVTFVGIVNSKVTKSDIARIGRLKHLHSLDLEGCDVSPAALVAISHLNLAGLHLPSTNVDDNAIATICQMSSLCELDLSSTAVTAEGFDDLQQLKQLTALFLDDTHISNLSPLSSLTTLKCLRLGNTQVTDLSPLANLSRLRELFVHNTEVKDLSPLRELTELQHLGVWGTPACDLTPLTSLAKLQQLAIADTAVSDEQVAKFQEALPDCKIVR